MCIELSGEPIQQLADHRLTAPLFQFFQDFERLLGLCNRHTLCWIENYAQVRVILEGHGEVVDIQEPVALGSVGVTLPPLAAHLQGVCQSGY